VSVPRPLAVAVGMVLTSCSSGARLSPAHAAALADSVRTFVAAIEHGVNHNGPAAWRRVFADSAPFFMASEGKLVFANSDAAKRGIDDLVASIKRIELKWGDSVLIDPLAPGLAAMGAPYHEVRVDTAGVRTEETGYFTGLAEHHASGWRLRDAHWSVMGPKPTAQCRDGTYSYSETRSGTCSSHGGVARWL